MPVECEHAQEVSRYVLGTLSQHAREEFHRHAEDCPVCQDELELLERAADASALIASPLLQADAEGPQATGADRTPNATGAHRTRLPRASVAASRAKASPAEPPRRPPSRRSAQATWKLRPAFVLLGIVLIAAVLIRMADRPGKVVYYHGTTAWRTAAVAVEENGSSGELLVERLPSPPGGDAYEVWVVPRRGRDLTLADGSVQLNSDGEAGIPLPGDIRDDEAVTVYARSAALSTKKGITTLSDHPAAVVYLTGKHAR